MGSSFAGVYNPAAFAGDAQKALGKLNHPGTLPFESRIQRHFIQLRESVWMKAVLQIVFSNQDSGLRRT
jgi:hypothetical protein